ncbi:MAG TPA: hypothetical protein VFM58_16125 [Solirubrobacteraceae bacterium]|nr:hypothetical protein [Solirubrobacteraceae bacterium]
MRAVFVLVAACVVAAALPATASAATWKGKTRQGRGVAVRTGADGTVERVRIGWKARCADGTYTSRTLFLPPLDSATSSTFADAGSYRGHPAGYRARIRVRVAGDLDAGDQTWSGTFRVKVRVSKGGESVDTCRLKRLRWSAAPA